MTTPYEQLEPGLKVAAQMSPEATEDDFAFARQMGVGHAVAWTDASKASPDYYCQPRDRYGDAGITLYGLGNGATRRSRSTNDTFVRWAPRGYRIRPTPTWATGSGVQNERRHEVVPQPEASTSTRRPTDAGEMRRMSCL